VRLILLIAQVIVCGDDRENLDGKAWDRRRTDDKDFVLEGVEAAKH
jgi:hypothetical protein